MNLERRVEVLRKHIKHHDYKYYIEDSPEIPDEAYDLLIKELENIEEENPELITPDSPTQTVGYGYIDSDFTNTLKKVKHKRKVLSLNKARNEEELDEWLNKMIKDYHGEELELAYKADGLSLILYYSEGVLERAVTRGNGEEGEDVTESALKIFTAMNYIAKEKDMVRGEVVLPKHKLDEINKKRKEEGKEEFSNCRNAAAGILRNKEISDYVEDLVFYTHNEDLVITKYELYPQNTDAIIESCKKVENNREELDFDIDGVVVRFTDKEVKEGLGKTSHHPKWAIAYKFKAESTDTILKDITYQVSRTGRINPVAILEPVELAGAKIERATLHNFEFIEELNLHLGDRVILERSGDVIPKIVENIDQDTRHSEKVKYPNNCPVCGAKTFWDENGTFLYCRNDSCPAKVDKKIEHFIKAMDIKYLGNKTLNKIIDKFTVKYPYELYKLNVKKLTQLEGIEEKSAIKIINEIADSIENDLYQVIWGLGIKGVGKSVAKDLADEFKSLENLRKANIKDLKNIRGIGSKMAKDIVEYFRNPSNKELVKKIEEYVMPFYEEKNKGKFTGIRFAITGTFNISRKEIKKKLEEEGGEVKGFAKSKTDILLAGENAGSKLEKAKKAGVEIWGYLPF